MTEGPSGSRRDKERTGAGSRRATYHHGDLRRALVEAALEALEREGAGALTLRALAARVGVSPAAPYRHFRDRSELLAVLAEEGFRGLERALGVAFLTEGEDPFRRLHAVAAAYVDFAGRRPGQFRIMFGEGGGREEAGLALRAASLAALEPLQQAAHDCWLASGRAGDPGEAVIAAWSLVHGLASLRAEGRLEHLAGARGAEDLVAGSLGLLLGGGPAGTAI
jgi:AcrR family transcriptional regulator